MKRPDEEQRGLLRDLTDPCWITIKGALFLFLGLLAAGLLLAEHPSLIDAALLMICAGDFAARTTLPSTSSSIMWTPAISSRGCGPLHVTGGVDDRFQHVLFSVLDTSSAQDTYPAFQQALDPAI